MGQVKVRWQRRSFGKTCLMLVLGAGAMSFVGCRVDSNKNGKSDDVKIATPFGGMQVKTNDSVSAEGVGIPLYPGATVIPKEDGGKNDGAADVNMNFGAFHLRVKALSYHSSDGEAKIADFYRKALGKYGDIIQCDHERPVGTPTRTAQGLTCDSKQGVNVDKGPSGNLQLKTGSPQHQHIVALDKDDAGTKIGLVSLDLPGQLSFGSDGDAEKQ